MGWSFDAANRFTGISLPNGITSTVVPDAANEINSITYAKGATTIASVSYGYDADGHRTSASGTLVRPILDAGLAGTNYDAGNHLTALSTGALTYDGNFNLQTQAGANPASYTWNDRNQLTGTSNGTVLNYDALGRLVSRTQAGTTTSFLYDGGNQVMVNGSLMIRGPNLDEVETQVTASGTINYLTDGLGSTSMLTDSNGNVTTLYSYGAYGATATSGVSGPATVDTSFKYTGADYNSVDDLYYFRRRYYSPHLQRFISEDPVGLAGGINRNSYADGNPLSESDPNGECPWCIGAIIGGGFDLAAQLAAHGGNWHCVNAGEVIASAAFGALGGGFGGRGLVKGLFSLSRSTKGAIGEGLSYIENTLAGSTNLGTQVGIDGLTTIADSQWQSILGDIYYVESKFGTAGLTSAQRAAAAALGDAYQVERWTYPFIERVGAYGGGTAVGVAAGVNAGGGN